MDRNQIRKILRPAVVSIVSGVVVFLLTRWIDRDKISKVSILPPSQADAEHVKAVKLQELVDRMWNEANYDELSDLSRDAVAYRNGYSELLLTADRTGADDLPLVLEELDSQLSTYASECGQGSDRKSEKETYCERVADFYLKPSLSALSKALVSRLNSSH